MLTTSICPVIAISTDHHVLRGTAKQVSTVLGKVRALTNYRPRGNVGFSMFVVGSLNSLSFPDCFRRSLCRLEEIAKKKI